MFRQVARLAKRRSVWGFREFSAVDVSSAQKGLVLAENKYPHNQLLCKVRSVDSWSRGFAKNRDKKKEKNKRVRYDENELKEYFDVEKLMDEIAKPLEAFKEELIQHTSVRSSPGTIEHIRITYDGEEYNIHDLAEVGKKTARLYVLDFSSFPAAIPAALRALQNSELNLNVHQEGTTVIVPIPRVNKEHRELLARKSKLYFFKCKDGIREIQLKYIKSLAHMDKLPSQAKFRITEQLTALGDHQIQIAKELLKVKQNDLVDEEE